MQDKFTFDLTSPIKVSVNTDGKNEFVELDKLYLSAPTYKHKDQTLVLKKKFIEAIFGMTQSLSQKEAQSKVDSSEEKPLDAKAVKSILYIAKDFDIGAFYDKFRKLLVSDLCFKDEIKTQSLKSLELQSLSEEDEENLIAKYCEFFFLSSWMKTLN
jgi:hypothetical protein